MKTLQKIDAWQREPVYSHWRKDEILRPATLGFYCILLTIAVTYLVISVLPL